MKAKQSRSGFVGGTVWTTISFVVVTIVYLLRISILTRYLDKSDFGLVAIVLMILGFTNIFADLGVSSALLSQNNVNKKEYSSLYWGGGIISILLYFVVTLSTPLFSRFYNEPFLNTLIPVMAVDLIISAIGRQFAVFKQKDFRFKELAIIKIVSELFSLLVAAVLAYNGYGIWSLVASILVASFINSVLNFILGIKLHPLSFNLNYSQTKHLYKIGFYQAGSQVLDYISSQIDILILGKMIPMADMGVYSIIKNLVLKIYSSINQIVTKVAVPIFSKLKDNTVKFREKYLEISSGIMLVNTVCYLIIMVNSSETLSLFYGSQYSKYADILQFLCVWGVFSSIVNCASVLIVISTGRTDLGFRWTQLRLFLNPLFIVVGAYFGGILGTAIAQAIYSFITIFFYREVVVKKILPSLSNRDFLLVLYRPILLAATFYCVFYFARNYVPLYLTMNVYLKYSLSAIVIAGCYFLVFKNSIRNVVKL
ncbi:MOP flippase family protein [Sphingobacterium bambusae]|uniref:MOP flippase family protein n=1 Tax=Sphingobacterium bambusae TaxID=662858 RepID=A0ABW6BDS7_9SPHI|nr:MOP flippase family protein [Sphingobacterium bambusae]WPL46853.1 MOP flippase family protein [Sphingobacterium bambusae]